MLRLAHLIVTAVAFASLIGLPSASTAQTVKPPLQQVLHNGVTLDPNGMINRDLLKAALASLEQHADRVRNFHRIGIADLGSESRFVRFYVVNLYDGSVRSMITTHGKGSDPQPVGRAVRVSNIPGSEASSVGGYVTGEHYYSSKHHSDAVRLDGLDPTNSNARCRCIVIHAANRDDGSNYASAAWIKKYGTAGRSNGCFAFAREDIRYVLERMEPGSFLYAGPISLASFSPVAQECDCL